MTATGDAAGALHAALVTALGEVAGLNRVEPGASVRASPPFAEIGAIEARDWGTKDRAGAELRVHVVVRDLAEQSARLHGLSASVAEAVAALPRDLSDDGRGWRIASCVLLRSRTASEKAGNWAATLEWRVRVLEE